MWASQKFNFLNYGIRGQKKRLLAVFASHQNRFLYKLKITNNDSFANRYQKINLCARQSSIIIHGGEKIKKKFSFL